MPAPEYASGHDVPDVPTKPESDPQSLDGLPRDDTGDTVHDVRNGIGLTMQSGEFLDKVDLHCGGACTIRTMPNGVMHLVPNEGIVLRGGYANDHRNRNTHSHIHLSSDHLPVTTFGTHNGNPAVTVGSILYTFEPETGRA